jgi:hypothetical protein
MLDLKRESSLRSTRTPKQVQSRLWNKLREQQEKQWAGYESRDPSVGGRMRCIRLLGDGRMTLKSAREYTNAYKVRCFLFTCV